MITESPSVLKGMRTPPGTEHQPTHRRTLSGGLVPINDDNPRLGWVELVVDYTVRQKEAEAENPPPVRERLGEHYQGMRHVPDPLSLVEDVCSLCGKPMSAEECRKSDTDYWDSHAIAKYSVNRRMKRAAGYRTGYTAHLHATLGTAWVDAHEKDVK